jgi:hypothetical protein
VKYFVASAVVCSALLSISFHVLAAEPGYRFLWVRTMLGPCCADAGVDLIVDADGAALVAGYRGGLDLNLDGKVEVRPYGLKDALIFKSYDKATKGWVQGPGGPGWDEAMGIASDRKGGAYAAGYFEQEMNIAGGTIRSAGPRDGFLARYNQDGETQWAKPIGGAGRDQMEAVGSDAAGNAYLTGTVNGEIDIDRDGSVDVKTGPAGLLLASFDRDGGLRWARASGGEATVTGRAVTVGPKDEVYIGGHYSNGALDLDADGAPDGPAKPRNKPNGYFARFDTSGKMVWSRVASSPGVQAVGSLATAGNGDLLVLGGGSGPTDLNGDGVPDIEIPSGELKVFLARFTPSGELVWVRTYAANAAHVSASATRIAMVGFYEGGPLDLDGDSRIDGPADLGAKSQGFVAILDNEGNLLHVFIIDGPDSQRALAAGFMPDGKQLYVTGYVRLTPDFDGDGIGEAGVRCDALGDVFLAMYAIAN